MTEVRLIDAKQLWDELLSRKTWESCYDRITTMNIIDTAPTVPDVPIACHERMKREMHSEITALKKQLAEVTAERDKAVEDLRKAAQCDTCKHNGDIFCNAEACKDGDQWQWRGTVSRTLSPAAKNNILNDFMKGVE